MRLLHLTLLCNISIHPNYLVFRAAFKISSFCVCLTQVSPYGRCHFILRPYLSLSSDPCRPDSLYSLFMTKDFVGMCAPHHATVHIHHRACQGDVYYSHIPGDQAHTYIKGWPLTIYFCEGRCRDKAEFSRSSSQAQSCIADLWASCLGVLGICCLEVYKRDWSVWVHL